MSEKLYLVEMDFDKPYVSVSIPRFFMDATAVEQAGYRLTLGAGFVQNEEFSATSFYKNISDVSQDIRRFFGNFFKMLDSMQKREPDLPTNGTWMATIETCEGQSTEIVENSYLEFKNALMQVLSSY